MRIFYWQQHYQQTLACFVEWQSLQQQALIPASSMEHLQHQLRVHLAIIAEDETRLPAQASSAAEAFVQLAVGFLKQRSLSELADSYIGNEILRPGLLVAIEWFAMKKLCQYLCDSYLPKKYPELLTSAIGLNIYLADHVLRQAMQCYEDPAMQIAAIKFATYDSRYGIAIFREFYQRLLTTNTFSEPQRLLLPASLWAGLLRQEASSKQYFSVALKLLPENATLHYYAALQGDAEFLIYLIAFAKRQPTPGLYYLALFGRKLVLGELIDALKKPATKFIAADAWQTLTGEQLSLRTGLYDASLEGNGREQAQPDVTIAEQWVQSNNWLSSERYLFGQVVSSEILSQHLKQYHGYIRQYIRDLLALQEIKIEYSRDQLCVN